MFLHQFGENFVLGLQLGFQLFNAFLFGFFSARTSFVESGCPVLEKLLLPAVKNGWLQVVFIAQIRDRNPVNQVSLKNEHLLLSCVIFAGFAHIEFLRCCRLTQTAEFSNSR